MQRSDGRQPGLVKPYLCEKGTMRVTTLLAFFTCFASLAPAQDIALPKWADAQARTPVEWPDSFTGVVQDETKKPIANAKVLVAIEIQLYPPGGGIVEKAVYQRKVTTDEDGKWSLPTKEFPKIVHRPFVVVVKASTPKLIPWRIWTWYGADENKAKGPQKTITLAAGNEVSGVCVDENGNPAKGVRFRITHVYGGVSGSWAARHYECNDRGEFKLMVPKSGETAFWIYGDTVAPAFKRVPKVPTANLKYKLKSGARAIGFVKDASGKPVADVVVRAVGRFTGDIRAFSIPFVMADRTDQRGRFRLPPLNGEYQFQLTTGETLLDGSIYLAPKPAPLMVPVLRKLESGREGLGLRASKTAVISGVTRWPDKSPAANVPITVYDMPEGNGSGVMLGQVLTDKEGRYSMRVPVPIESLLVSTEGRRFKGKYHWGQMQSESPQFQDSTGSAIADLFEKEAVVNFDFAERRPR